MSEYSNTDSPISTTAEQLAKAAFPDSEYSQPMTTGTDTDPVAVTAQDAIALEAIRHSGPPYYGGDCIWFCACGTKLEPVTSVPAGVPAVGWWLNQHRLAAVTPMIVAATLCHARQMAESERLLENTGESDDVAYNQAIDDVQYRIDEALAGLDSDDPTGVQL
jgi:hypothetical protein